MPYVQILISIRGRLNCRILRYLFVEEYQEEGRQCGFPAGRSVNENTLSLKKFMGKKSLQGINSYFTFSSWKVPLNLLLAQQKLKNSNINYTLINPIWNIY